MSTEFVCVFQATMIVGQNKLCRVCKQVVQLLVIFALMRIFINIFVDKTRNSKIEAMKYPTNLLIFEHTENKIRQNVGNIVRK